MVNQKLTLVLVIFKCAILEILWYLKSRGSYFKVNFTWNFGGLFHFKCVRIGILVVKVLGHLFVV